MNRFGFISGKTAPKRVWKPFLPNGFHLDCGRVQDLIMESKRLLHREYTDVTVHGDEKTNLMKGIPAAVFKFTNPYSEECIYLSIQHVRWLRAPDEYRDYIDMEDGLERFIQEHLSRLSYE